MLQVPLLFFLSFHFVENYLTLVSCQKGDSVRQSKWGKQTTTKIFFAQSWFEFFLTEKMPFRLISYKTILAANFTQLSPDYGLS